MTIVFTRILTLFSSLWKLLELSVCKYGFSVVSLRTERSRGELETSQGRVGGVQTDFGRIDCNYATGRYKYMIHNIK